MNRRRLLETVLKWAAILGVFGILYVFFDFAIDFRPNHIQESYRFSMPELEPDKPVVLQRDQLRIIVLKRSEILQKQLLDTSSNLQDPESKRSRQPKSAENPLRSKTPDLFVALALGTDLQCLLSIETRQFKETCSDATYDFAGRSKNSNRRINNLTVPDYRLSDDGQYLFVSP